MHILVHLNPSIEVYHYKLYAHRNEEINIKEKDIFSDGWDKTVNSYLLALASDPKETLWPRDTLFKYDTRQCCFYILHE